MILSENVTNSRVSTRFKTLESDLYAIFGDKLDFTDPVYAGMHVYFWYHCNIHNQKYKTKPYRLLNTRGCPDCGHEARASYAKSQALKAGLVFAEKAEKIHPNKYDYTMVWYRNNYTLILVWCKSCNKFFKITPNALLRGSGCERCGAKAMAFKQSTEARENFPSKAELIHPNKNYYHLVEYTRAHDDVTLWCIGCGVPYELAPNLVLKGYSHSACSDGGGFKPDKAGILYYLRVETRNQICYKIGITNRSIQERFSNSDLELITIIYEIRYEVGRDAYVEEQRLLMVHKEHRYKGDPLLESGGNTELFSKDVLQLDDSIK